MVQTTLAPTHSVSGSSNGLSRREEHSGKRALGITGEKGSALEKLRNIDPVGAFVLLSHSTSPRVQNTLPYNTVDVVQYIDQSKESI